MFFCRSFVRNAQDYLEGTLPPSQKEAIERHLRRCRRCRERKIALLKIEKLFIAHPSEPFSLSDERADALFERTLDAFMQPASTLARPPFRRGYALAGASVALALGLFAALWMRWTPPQFASDIKVANASPPIVSPRIAKQTDSVAPQPIEKPQLAQQFRSKPYRSLKRMARLRPERYKLSRHSHAKRLSAPQKSQVASASAPVLPVQESFVSVRYYGAEADDPQSWREAIFAQNADGTQESRIVTHTDAQNRRYSLAITCAETQSYLP